MVDFVFVVAAVVLVEAKAGNVDKNMVVELLSLLKTIFFLRNQMTIFEFIIVKGSFSSIARPT